MRPETARLEARTGVYHYFLNDRPAGVIEPWEVRASEDGAARVKVSRDATRSFGIELEVEADLRDGLVSRFSVRFASSRGPVRRAWAEYAVEGERLRIEREVDEVRAPAEVEPWPPGVLLAPLMRIFAGPVIANLLARKGGLVLVPRIDCPDDRRLILSRQIETRQAAVIGRDVLRLAGRELTTRLCSYTSSRYPSDARFWLDERDTLVRYRWQEAPGSVWDVVLLPSDAPPPPVLEVSTSLREERAR